MDKKLSLADECPKLAAEWSDKNKLSPAEVTAGSRKAAVWKCSKCGNEWSAIIKSRAKLGNGCPYCGTQYKMDDLFPKITSYYFFDQLRITKKQLLIGLPACIGFCALMALILRPFVKDFPIYETIMRNAYQNGTESAIIYAFTSVLVTGTFLFLLLHLCFKIAKAIVDLDRMGTAESRSRFELRMKKITPEFSFEFFKNKAISLIKTAVYSRNENELLCYRGGPLPAEFKDIIDLNYAGTFGLKGFSEENGVVTVETRSYVDVLSIKDDQVSYTHPVISATFQRRTDIPINLNFSMTRIQCPTCGASFNPVKNKYCPNCGNEYELITDDWVLVDLKMLK